MAIFPVGSTAATFSGDVATLPVGSVSATFLGMRFPKNVPTYRIGYNLVLESFLFLATFSGVATFLVVTGPTCTACFVVNLKHVMHKYFLSFYVMNYG